MEERRNITDPKALRALAHPLRWKLIEFVGREGTATATQCAQETGESVANCSYHLNLLAKYDYVEQAEGGQGREKPWRLVHQGQSISDVGMDKESELAAQAASGAFLDYALAQIKERSLTAHLEPDEWRLVLGISNNTDYMTPAEVQEIVDTVRTLLDKFGERRADPSLRPEGSRPVTMLLSSTVAPQQP
ncbi:winged helix-turn-helix domain-containing protein [Actinophytocola oryzae]|uniref:ArsR family transcriptional regulator n=1 Tax=Actinophytocola oryzae TaxID=502181 RepID=A0A4V3FQG1_9PSEU|nr:helix-turn-helix domain-containing protein [Actinophytocola oryzae]TDV38716.1 ArsR family transcriptional regulator [Actinophytocola oryzae]